MIYLDNAATTLYKPPEVGAAVLDAMRTCANAGRGGHSAAMVAADKLYECREAAAELFGFDRAEQAVFTFNTTHSLNIAIKGIMSNGGHCVISGFEHNSVVRPLKAMEKLGVSYTVAYSRLFDAEDTLRAIKNAVREDTVCVVCTHVSNVFGYILPIKEIDEFCNEKGIALIIDAAQSAGTVPIKLNEFKAVKCICVPGHKGLYGPQGTGLLLINDNTSIPSLMQGGTGSMSGKPEQPDFLPDMHESGTQNIHGIAGLCEGIRYILKVGVDKIAEYERGLILKAKGYLSQIPRIKMYASDDAALQNGVLSFNVEGKSSEDIASKLAEKGIAVRAGLHCAPIAHKSAGTKYGTVRISVSWFNNEEEISAFAYRIGEIV